MADCDLHHLNMIFETIKTQMNPDYFWWHSFILFFIIIEPDDPKRKGKRQRGGSSAFLASLPLSDALVKFLNTGENALPRSDVIKRIWDYIKQNNLQVVDENLILFILSACLHLYASIIYWLLLTVF